jgi:hypothetical protein
MVLCLQSIGAGFEADLEILGDRQFREYLPTLRNQRDAGPGPLMGGQSADNFLSQRHSSRGLLEEPHDVFHQRGFADAVAAHLAGHFSLRHLHGQIVQGLNHAVGEGEMFDGEHDDQRPK